MKKVGHEAYTKEEEKEKERRQELIKRQNCTYHSLSSDVRNIASRTIFLHTGAKASHMREGERTGGRGVVD